MIGWIAWTLISLTMLVAVILTIVVMIQESKDGSSQAIGNTFYGSNKGNTRDGMLSKITIILAIAFVILCTLTTIAVIK